MRVPIYKNRELREIDKEIDKEIGKACTKLPWE
jgi:hypothetical protein